MGISFATNGHAGDTYTSTSAGQWTADGVDISGETGTTYVLSVANEGKVIRCGTSNGKQVWTLFALTTKLIAWWDPRTGITLNVTKVSSWADRVNGWAMANATDSQRPTYNATGLNGKPSLDFDRTASQRLTTVSGSSRAQPFVRFAVGSLTPYGLDVSMFDGQTSSNRGGLVYVNGSARFFMYAGTTTIDAEGANYVSGTPFIVATVYRTASSYGSFNGSAQATGDPGSHASRLAIIGAFPAGVASYWNGPMSHNIDCTDLTTDEIQRVEGYLSTVTGKALVSGHPYINGVPLILDEPSVNSDPDAGADKPRKSAKRLSREKLYKILGIEEEEDLPPKEEIVEKVAEAVVEEIAPPKGLAAPLKAHIVEAMEANHGPLINLFDVAMKAAAAERAALKAKQAAIKAEQEAARLAAIKAERDDEEAIIALIRMLDEE